MQTELGNKLHSYATVMSAFNSLSDEAKKNVNNKLNVDTHDGKRVELITQLSFPEVSLIAQETLSLADNTIKQLPPGSDLKSKLEDKFEPLRPKLGKWIKRAGENLDTKLSTDEEKRDAAEILGWYVYLSDYSAVLALGGKSK